MYNKVDVEHILPQVKSRSQENHWYVLKNWGQPNPYSKGLRQVQWDLKNSKK